MDLLFLISILTTALVLALLALVRQVRLQRALRRLLSPQLLRSHRFNCPRRWRRGQRFVVGVR